MSSVAGRGRGWKLRIGAGIALATLIAAAAAGLRPTASAVDVLVDSEAVFPAVLQLIRSAQDEVLLSMYMLGGESVAPGDPAGIGLEIVDALAERRAAGVRVRVLSTRFEVAEDRREPGTFATEDVWLHPVFDEARSRGIPILRPEASAGSIDHTKYLVVDGRTAIFGGMNLADAVATNHDLMVRVSGPAVARLEDAFEASWSRAVRAHGPDPRTAEDAPLVRHGSALAQAMSRAAAVREGADSCDVEVFVNTPDAHPLEPALLTILERLERGDRLRVAMLLFTAGKLVDGVVAAQERGASVTVAVDPERALYGVDCVTADNAASVAKLAGAGVPTRLYDVARGQELHMKVFVADIGAARVWGVGSANWAGSDMSRNSELTGIFTGCPATAAKVSALLDADFEARATPPTPAQLACFNSGRCRASLRKTCGERLRRSWLSGRR